MILIRIYRVIYLLIVMVMAIIFWPVAILLEKLNKRPEKFIEIIFKGAREDLLYKKENLF